MRQFDKENTKMFEAYEIKLIHMCVLFIIHSVWELKKITNIENTFDQSFSLSSIMCLKILLIPFSLLFLSVANIYQRVFHFVFISFFFDYYECVQHLLLSYLPDNHLVYLDGNGSKPADIFLGTERCFRSSQVLLFGIEREIMRPVRWNLQSILRIFKRIFNHTPSKHI